MRLDIIHLNELMFEPTEINVCDIEPEAIYFSIISNSKKFSDQSEIIPRIGTIK